ncbi:hypothetical protein GW17_00019810 [Ensete ventricosum]|nr:hypothetical protein GW17_00019810 [Ensete ventricosum]
MPLAGLTHSSITQDQKKLQGQLIAEQEALYGSKPSPLKPQSAKKVHNRTSNGGPSRRLSLGGAAAMQPPKPDYLHSAKSARSTKKMDDLGTLSPGARGLDIAGLPMKKLSFTTHQEMGAPRKPFAPLAPVNNIPSTPSRPIPIAFEDSMTSNAMPAPTPKTPAKPITGAVEENKTLNALPAPTAKTTAAAPMPTPSKPITMTSSSMSAPTPRTPAAGPAPTPSKPITSAPEQNKTSTAIPAPTPKTPAAAPMPMQVATTPAPTCLFKETAPRVAPVEELEYSFEERRLAFYLSR